MEAVRVQAVAVERLCACVSELTMCVRVQLKSDFISVGLPAVLSNH